MINSMHILKIGHNFAPLPHLVREDLCSWILSALPMSDLHNGVWRKSCNTSDRHSFMYKCLALSSPIHVSGGVLTEGRNLQQQCRLVISDMM